MNKFFEQDVLLSFFALSSKDPKDEYKIQKNKIKVEMAKGSVVCWQKQTSRVLKPN